MSNYVKAVDYSAKDALASGNPNKIIKGTELNDEFNAIATAIGTKADLASPAFLGNPTATTQPFGNSSSRLATTAFTQAALASLYLPIGFIFISAVAGNPASVLGYGTWVAFGAGRCLFGLDSGNTAFDVVEETGGSADAVVVSHTHTTTVTDPGHSHNTTVYVASDSGGGVSKIGGGANIGPTGGAVPGVISNTTGVSVGVSTTGVSATNANLPPYITVYMWKRTA